MSIGDAAPQLDDVTRALARVLRARTLDLTQATSEMAAKQYTGEQRRPSAPGSFPTSKRLQASSTPTFDPEMASTRVDAVSKKKKNDRRGSSHSIRGRATTMTVTTPCYLIASTVPCPTEPRKLAGSKTFLRCYLIFARYWGEFLASRFGRNVHKEGLFRTKCHSMDWTASLESYSVLDISRVRSFNKDRPF